MFAMGCQDPSPIVAEEALGATANYIEAISGDPVVMEMKPVLTPMLHILASCVQRGEMDDLVLKGLEVISECCNMEFPLINDHVEVC